MSHAGTIGQPSAGDSPAARQEFERELLAFRGAATAFARDTIKDANVRREYQAAAQAAIDELRWAVENRRMTAEEGARQAAAQRNSVLAAIRDRTSPFWRSIAELLKKEGPTFEALIERYAKRLYDLPPDKLSPAQREEVMRRILDRASVSNPRVNMWMSRFGRAGRGFVALSIGISIYNIATSENPGRQTAREATGIGAGFVGTLAGGAAGSLVCGPGAPVCMGIFVIVGGAAFALGVDWAVWGG